MKIQNQLYIKRTKFFPSNEQTKLEHLKKYLTMPKEGSFYVLAWIGGEKHLAYTELDSVSPIKIKN